MSSQSAELEKFSRVWIRNALSTREISSLLSAVFDHTKPGARISLDPRLQSLLGPNSRLTRLAQSIQPKVQPVRITCFNKTTTTNWSVPWHQDRVIAVRMKHEISDFGCWTKKSDYWHVEPPETLLKSMIFARVHLDAEGPSTGGLELALGSHVVGKITSKQAADYANRFDWETCDAQPGDVVFIKALTLHKSSPSQTANSRRTLRIDYCAETLPSPLQWAILE